MKDITVLPTITILQAMKKLESTAEKCLLVVNKDNNLIGTLTDGDLRRRILSGASFSESVDKSMCAEPIYFFEDNFNNEEAKKLLKNKNISLIPIVDKNQNVKDYISWSGIGKIKPQKSLDDVPVVIMAGGKGTRLKPFTNILPKPLIPIREKPIIEHIIERFTAIFCNQFFLTVNYKGSILKAFFEELQPDYTVSFIEESDPTGTAGSLSALKGKINKSFFVTNCDIIIKVDYVDIYNFHRRGNYDLTLIASAKEYVIPYGTCELNKEGHLSKINEKPRFDFLISTGLYVLKPGVINYIPNDKIYHMTDLIETLKREGKNVGVYPIDDNALIDVGQWEEYKKALEQL